MFRMKTVVLFGFVLGALSAAGRVVVTKPGMSVVLDCGVSSYSKSLKWQRGDTHIISQASGGHLLKGKNDIGKRSSLRQTNLRISDVKHEDAGKFTLMLDGRSHDVTLVVVSVSASPSTDLQRGSNATLRCQISGLNPGPTVQWKKPGKTLDQTGSEVQLKPVASSDGGTWICTFPHSDGAHEEKLEIKVQEPPTTPAPAPAPDPSQKSKDNPKTNCHTCSNTSPPKAGQLLGLSWWMWVIVGVGCLVVVLLLVFVICLYKRIKRKRRKLQKLKNSRMPLTTKPYCQCDRPTAAAKPQQGRRREKPSAPPLQPLLME